MFGFKQEFALFSFLFMIMNRSQTKDTDVPRVGNFIEALKKSHETVSFPFSAFMVQIAKKWRM